MSARTLRHVLPELSIIRDTCTECGTALYGKPVSVLAVSIGGSGKTMGAVFCSPGCTALGMEKIGKTVREDLARVALEGSKAKNLWTLACSTSAPGRRSSGGASWSSSSCSYSGRASSLAASR